MHILHVTHLLHILYWIKIWTPAYIEDYKVAIIIYLLGKEADSEACFETDSKSLFSTWFSSLKFLKFQKFLLKFQKFVQKLIS